MEGWIAEAIGRMHVNKLTNKMVAAEMGVTNEYFSMIVNGKRAPKGVEDRVSAAIDRLIATKQ